jgi:short-subunit dehydrogenase
MTFANQVAVVTGASSGIGRGVAIALAAQRCQLGLIARREDRLKELVAEIERTGGTAKIAVADISIRAQCLAAFNDLRNTLGPVDLLVANAGLGLPDRVEPLSVDDIEAMIQVNYLGVVYSIEAVLPDMLSRGAGHLAAVSSQGAYKGMPGSAGYCASKAAVSTFMESLRIELRSRGIAVTTICPGFVRTEMTAENAFFMPGLLEADDAGRRIVRAIARKKKVYNFPWQTTLLMKAARWLPDWVIDRMSPRKGGHATS